MSILGLDLNDAALTGVADGELLFREPGYALAPDGTVVFGLEAHRQARRFPHRVQNRYWRDLSDEPLPAPLGSAYSAADLVHGHLAGIMARGNHEAVAFSIPWYWTAQQLGLLLGIAQEQGATVAGLVDATVAATRRKYPGHELLMIEASLHESVISEIGQHEAAEVRARHVLPDLGVDTLERECVAYFAQCFLHCARFDPLHDAASEQQLHDRIGDWLEALARNPRFTAAVEYQGREFHATLDREELADRLDESLQPLLQRLRALLPVGRPAAIQLGATLAPFPGLVDTLAALSDIEVFLLEPGAAAQGACRVAVRASVAGGRFRLLTRLPFDLPPALEQGAVVPGSRSSGVPTHLVYGKRAYRIGPRPLSIGAEAGPGGYGIVLDDGRNGVSRQHCTVGLEDGQAILVDHSRFGTRLNGHCIDGSAVLQAGDRISIGSPACEFSLVAEVQADGA